MKTRIYLAGPLFTAAEREWNWNLARALESAGFSVWLPQDHEPGLDVASERWANAVFEQDLMGIDDSDVVLAIMDGPDPDSGTAWECGYAYAKGKPVYMVRTDFRKATEIADVPYNIMLSASATARREMPFGSTNEIVEFAKEKILK